MIVQPTKIENSSHVHYHPPRPDTLTGAGIFIVRCLIILLVIALIRATAAGFAALSEWAFLLPPLALLALLIIAGAWLKRWQ